MTGDAAGTLPRRPVEGLRDRFRDALAAGGVAILWRHVVPADEERAALLPAEERAAAARLHQAQDRAAYVATHLAMRTGFALAGLPFAAALRREPGGRPFLAGHPLHLSASRTRGLIGCAFAQHAIGFDVEARGRLGPLDDLLPLIATAAERRELGRLDGPARVDAALGLWTRKEAVLKAIGCGLSLPPDSFAVSGRPPGVTGLPERWQGPWHFTERWLDGETHAALAAPEAPLPLLVEEFASEEL